MLTWIVMAGAGKEWVPHAGGAQDNAKQEACGAARMACPIFLAVTHYPVL
jgi:hypothetical protein